MSEGPLVTDVSKLDERATMAGRSLVAAFAVNAVGLHPFLLVQEGVAERLVAEGFKLGYLAAIEDSNKALARRVVPNRIEIASVHRNRNRRGRRR